MTEYSRLTRAEQEAEYKKVLSRYTEYKNMGLSLDLSRGKPNSDQLDISQGLLNVELKREDCFSENGFDCRNYGIVDGLPEVKRLFTDLLGIDKDGIIIGGNSSLQLMYDTLMRAMVFGVVGSERAWCREEKLKWICVVPGYDRHFRITEQLGFELLTVEMTESGPDMDAVERLALDPAVKGIWCVPKYSNPSGNTYSDETVRRLASMKTGAPDFRIFWDNAYAVHDFNENGDKLLDIFDACREAGNPNRVFYYSSTSKITFPGGGVAIMAASPENVADIKPRLSAATIGYDKLNQLRHLKFFGTAENVHKHMMRLASVISVKFDITLDALASLDGLGIASWTKPNGGYFISLDVPDGCAKRVWQLMRDAGVTLTPSGATHPHGIDPRDRTLRIAPTYPTDSELKTATDILTLAVRIAALEKLMQA